MASVHAVLSACVCIRGCAGLRRGGDARGVGMGEGEAAWAGHVSRGALCDAHHRRCGRARKPK
jgi:hypothetical protein